MIHRAMSRGQRSLIWPSHRSGDSGCCLGCIGEPEERDAVAPTTVEEEMLAHACGQLDRLDQGHPQHVCIEVHRALHVLAHEREVIDPQIFKLLSQQNPPDPNG